MNHFKVLAGIVVLAGLSACDSEPTQTSGQDVSSPAASAPARAAVNEARLVAADREPGQWMSYARTYDEQRFSPLDQINRDTVGDLGLAWYADLDTNRKQEATPIVVDGVIYVSTAWSKVNAYDARTGDVLWAYDPEVPGESGGIACCGVVNRGVAVWNGKVYVATLDGRLVALDADTGEEVWSVVTFDQSKPYTSTGAPRVVKGKVIIGNGGAELGVRGFVTAYDAETGDREWRFWTVPGDPAKGFENETMAMAAETWTGEWWDLGGGGTVWDAMAYDPELDLLYIGVGNGSPWNASVRSPDGGDNLFLSSIVALDPDTGDYVWHYQTTPWETWDFTATQTIIVADLEIEGAIRRVVMQAPKNGFFYVLDAATGELISAENFVPVNWAKGIDMQTGRPIENPDARYDVTGEPALVQPGAQGAHSWHPMAYSPETRLVYIPAQEVSLPYISAPGEEFGIFNIGVDWISGNYLYEEPGAGIEPGTTANLLAWDPVRQEEVWRVKYSGGPAGVLVTGGGLVFQGRTATEELVAYDAETGDELWAAPTRTGVIAAPASYEVAGEQYIAQLVGANQQGGYYASNHSRLLVFKRGGTLELPPAPPPPERELNPPELTASADVVARGEALYTRNCSICHGDGGNSRGIFPDLRYSSALYAQEDFDAVVLEGLRQDNGMRSFADSLGEEDTEALRAYVIKIANDALAQQQARTEQ